MKDLFKSLSDEALRGIAIGSTADIEVPFDMLSQMRGYSQPQLIMYSAKELVSRSSMSIEDIEGIFNSGNKDAIYGCYAGIVKRLDYPVSSLVANILSDIKVYDKDKNQQFLHVGMAGADAVCKRKDATAEEVLALFDNKTLRDSYGSNLICALASKSEFTMDRIVATIDGSEKFLWNKPVIESLSKRKDAPLEIFVNITKNAKVTNEVKAAAVEALANYCRNFKSNKQ